MARDNTQRIATIKALFATAERDCEDPKCKRTGQCAHEGEREAAREKANTLMALWEIEDAQLKAQEETKGFTAADIKDTRFFYDVPKSYEHEFLHLGWRVINAMGLRGATMRTTGHNGWHKPGLTLIGTDEDIERAQMLVMSITLQCHTALNRFGRTLTSGNGSYKWNQRRAFVIGFADRVSARIEFARTRAMQDGQSTGTDLVLVGKDVLTDRHAEAMGFKATKPRNYSSYGAGAGRLAGDQADIGQSKFGTNGARSIEG